MANTLSAERATIVRKRGGEGRPPGWKLAIQPIRSLRQQGSNTPLVLLQASDTKMMQRICLQVDLRLFSVALVVDKLSMLAYNIVVLSMQFFRC